MKPLISLATLAFSATLLSEAQPKPNILWLTFEDTSPHFIGCYGNEQASTPNIDKLAKGGVRFDNAYATGAVCSPSRFCLITGLHTRSMGTGNHRSGYVIPEYIKGFPYYLRQAGYYTSNNVKTDYNIANPRPFVQEAWNESSSKAGWWNRQPGQPFFAVYNSKSSHQSRTMTNPWSSYEELVLSQLEPDEVIPQGDLLLPAFYRNSEEMQKHISRVYNSIALMDKEFGQWLDRLEKEGLKDSTIVFCFSDHGQGITRGKGNALGFGYKVSFVAWFPPMYKHLSPWGEGVVTDELVSFEDMAPTVLKLAGLEIPDYMQGRVFAGEQPDAEKKYVFPALDRTGESSEISRSITDGKYLYTRVFMPFQPFIRWNMYFDVSELQHTIRADYKAGLFNDVQKAMMELRQPEYLFDVHNDIWETVNLIDRPELQDKVNELRTALIDQLIADRDAHFIPEYTFKTANKMPYELASDRNTYPIERVLDAALLIGKGEKALKQQFQFMNDANPYVRYWASIGLFSQQSGMKGKEKLLKKYWMQETYLPTKINLAVALFKNSNKKAYTNEIKRLLKEKNQELLRMTLHLLVSLDVDKKKILVDEIEKRYESQKSVSGNHAGDSNKLLLMYLHGVKQVPLR